MTFGEFSTNMVPLVISPMMAVRYPFCSMSSMKKSVDIAMISHGGGMMSMAGAYQAEMLLLSSGSIRFSWSQAMVAPQRTI
jgi:hypothetical protein